MKPSTKAVDMKSILIQSKGTKELARKKGRSISLQKVIVYILLSGWFIIAVLPFFWTFLTSIKKPVDAFAMPPHWIFEPTMKAYKTLWLEGDFSLYLQNSVIVTVGSVIISLAIGSLAGYALARYSGKSSFYLLLMALIFRALPRMVFVLPFYYIAKMLGLYDTKLMLILVMVAINQPFTIWMLKSFFMGIPKSLEEAAMVDGCTRFQAFRYVIVPIMWPGVITSGIFTLLLAYNEYLIPKALTATHAVTMPVAIAQFGAENIKYWSVMAAGAISISLPIILVVIFAQKYLVKGLTAGAVKE